MNIQEIRQKYPQYDDLSDQDLATALHQKFYSDIPFEDFSGRIGLQQQPEPEQRSLVEDIGRQAAMQGIEAVKGAGRFVMLPLDALSDLASLSKGAVNVIRGGGFKEGLYQGPRPSETITDPLTSIQPQPENALERVATSVSGALGGAAGGIGAGRALAGTALKTLAAEPGRQAVGAGTGATAAQLTAEAGGGPVAQTVAGLAGGLAASGAGRSTVAEGVKRSFRGGEEGRGKVAENIQAFEDAGTSPTVGQATQNRRMQASETLLSRAPGGAGVMAKTAENQAEEIGTNLERLATRLSPNASGEQAGRAIQRGISGEGGFVDQFKARSKNAYDQLDKHIPKDRKFLLVDTVKTLDDLTKPIAGAEHTSKFFINAKIKAIKEALDKDLFEHKDWSNGIPYEAVKKLRSIIGEQLADAPFNGDVPRSQWKRLYAAMTSDIEANTRSAGPQAQAALARANKYYASGMKRLDVIGSVIDKNGGPEAVFKAAISGSKEGATTLRAVMQSLPEDARKTLSATVLRRLGRAKPGQQDDLGEAFSTETFLTNWNAMSPGAKSVLFNRFGSDFRVSMDQVAKVAANLRQGSQVFRNPSGTAQASIQYTTAGAFIMSALTGNAVTTAAIGGGVGGSNLAARLMTHPPFVKWLAKTTRRPVEALPVIVNNLARSSDPLMREAAEALQQGQNQSQN